MSAQTEWPFKPGDKIDIVRAFIVGFIPDIIVAFRQDGKWYLPGGEVEHEGRSDHLSYLVKYVAEQTGLQLTSLSQAVAISMNKTKSGGEATIFYVGKAEGSLTHGQILDPKDIPELAPECRNAAASIRQFLGSDDTAKSSRS